ncbi:hypothetical protein [uncultured Oceanisphaera sp.]|uniref:hypothetical protein n=1 Tax=uncultured Oceanisphaera sp. TaxID=353858 RepID=UPI00262D8935|nr:hypothetical protein [uncultured Oceanisphaera sp.]
MKIFLSLLGLVIAIIIICIGMNLLEEKQITGGEFVSLVVAFSIIGLIISFSSEVQEFSVAGNIVKLKEVKKEAEESISGLKKARTDNFRFLLKLAMRFPGGFGSGGTVDSRLSDFWLLYDQIVEFGCELELRENIKSVTDVLLGGQLHSIAQNSDNVSSKFPRGTIPTPQELTITALDNESVEKAASRNVGGGDIAKIKESLVIGLDEYKRLYELNEQCKI